LSLLAGAWAIGTQACWAAAVGRALGLLALAQAVMRAAEAAGAWPGLLSERAAHVEALAAWAAQLGGPVDQEKGAPCCAREAARLASVCTRNGSRGTALLVDALTRVGARAARPVSGVGGTGAARDGGRGATRCRPALGRVRAPQAWKKARRRWLLPVGKEATRQRGIGAVPYLGSRCRCCLVRWGTQRVGLAALGDSARCGGSPLGLP